MINHISIKNFAIIENTEVDFEDGLNIITGETGAGKSIAIEAISLALGARADSSSIRTGSDKAIVELVGELNGDEIVIKREVSSNGKNLCKLNGEIVTLSNLNEATTKLADIHGQYDNQSLLNPEYHIELLDTYKTDLIANPKADVNEAYKTFATAKSKLGNLLSLEKENARKKDFYAFEIAEIDKADLRIGEDEELTNRVSLLSNSEKIFGSVDKAYSLMTEITPSVMDGLRESMRALQQISNYSKDLETLSSDFTDSYYKLEDLTSEIRNVKESLSFSPQELDSAISRLNLIDDLKKKYGNTVDEILSYRDKIASELNIIENFDDEKMRLEKALIDAKHELVDKCKILTGIRHKIAEELQEKIQTELLDLNFPDAKIEIAIESLSVPTENGMDNVEIMISTNKGEPLKPLYKVASGGEMSRIMLAFKNVISSYDKIPTLIFDEIDNGISGITASIVGKKLKEISKNHQIICITHLPQIAACGDQNYRIYKESDDSKTYTSIEKLDNDTKTKEIARLLGGATVTETTIKSAEELISSSH